jgi:PAS domain S-box-containing protein
MPVGPPAQTLAELEAENRRLRRAVEELSILNAIGSAIGSTMDLNEVVELIVQESAKHLDVEQASVLLLEQGEVADPFRTMARKAYSGTAAVPFRFGQQLTGWMLKNRRPLIVNDLAADERFRAITSADFPIKSLLSVPLRAKGQMVGLLNVFNKRNASGFSSEDERLLSIIASQSSQIVENARLYEELQRHSREAQDSEAKYRALMEESAEAILLASVADQRILEVNDRASEMTGLPRERLLGRTLQQVLPFEGFDCGGLCGGMGKGDTLRLAMSLPVTRSGERRFYDISATLVAYSSNQLLQVVGQDVTQREHLSEHLKVHAEELEREVDSRTKALRESQSRLVQQEKMAALGALVAGIAHELNTPIGTINSSADTLARSLETVRRTLAAPDTPESIREDKRLRQILDLLEDIARINKLACERIVAIVSSLRNFARLDEAVFQSVDLRVGLDSTLTLVRHELKNRISVVKYYEEIPPIRCHPNQVNQVFMNLLVNAAQAIREKGEIRLRTFVEDGMVAVSVQDNGVGIPEKNLANIFDPGFTTKGVGIGTGLGLSICFKIAQDHGGRIDVESQVGKGTTFTLRLPVTPPAANASELEGNGE